jgi:hypothetical protein
MNNILEPLFAILAIVVPLGLAYIILLWQSRQPTAGRRKSSATTPHELQHKMAKLSRYDEY